MPSLCSSQKKCKNVSSEEYILGEDRISNLQDSILYLIFSFLPTIYMISSNKLFNKENGNIFGLSLPFVLMTVMVILINLFVKTLRTKFFFFKIHLHWISCISVCVMNAENPMLIHRPMFQLPEIFNILN